MGVKPGESHQRPESEVPEMNSNEPALRGLWLAVITLAALVLGVCSGVAFHVSGAELPTSLGSGGGAFVAVMTLGLSARRFLSD